MSLMPIERIPDWEKRLARQDAFWRCEVLDRPVVIMSLWKENPAYPPPPQKTWRSLRERWWDTDHVAASALYGTMNTQYLGDALPLAYPNLGPEVFSAFFGQELEYSEGTSWSIPVLKDWSKADDLQFDRDGIYFRQIVKMTDALLAAGKGRFYTGLIDFHPGGDALAAFRDPINLCTDLLEYPDDVKALTQRVTDVYLEVHDFFCDKLMAAGQAISSWPGIVSSKRWYVPSNDFSCMISKKMFDEFFLPGIAEECAHMDASIYHLDGPGALQHLDSLLSIKELNAIQWVYGAGRGRASDWLPVYKKCQAAGKGLQIGVGVDELDTIMENLKPEGVWLSIGGAKDVEHAEALIKKVSGWRRGSVQVGGPRRLTLARRSSRRRRGPRA